MSLRVKNIFSAIGVIAICASCFFIGRLSVEHDNVVTKTTVDTIIVKKPVPYKVETIREVSIPVRVQAPTDTVVLTRVDSVFVEVPISIERVEYRDTLYHAVVSGPALGDVHPALETINIYSRIETRIIEKQAPLFRPYITACGGKSVLGVGAGVNIRGRALVGAKYMRINNDDAIIGEISWTF